MKQLSALDINYLIKEFQFLINSKVDKIYLPRKKEIILQLYAPSKGKYYLKIDEKSVYLTDYKPLSESPSQFCLYLRKKLANSRLRKIEQIDFERIIKLEFETKEEKFTLIAELFSKGNILLTKNNKILTASEYQNWKDRTIRPNILYQHPKKEYNFLKLAETKLKQALSKSTKENIIKSLAIDLGLGGVYSEEACILSKIDKEKKPNELTEKETKDLFKTLIKLKDQKINPKIVYKNKEVIDLIPFELEYYKKSKQEKAETYSSILNQYFSKENEIKQKEKLDQKTQVIQNIIKSQKEDIKRLEKQEKTNKEKGELVYQNYQLIDSILKELKDISKNHSWKEIKDKLKGHKLIKEVISKDKSIVLELK